MQSRREDVWHGSQITAHNIHQSKQTQATTLYHKSLRWAVIVVEVDLRDRDSFAEF